MHASGRPNVLLMSEHVRGVLRGGLYVGLCEMGISRDQRFFIRAFGNLAQDQLHRYPSASNDGFAEHNVGVDVDTIRDIHETS